MKKLIYIFTVFFVISLLTSCSTKVAQWETNSKQSTSSTVVKHADWFYPGDVKSLCKYAGIIISGEVVKTYEPTMWKINLSNNVPNEYDVYTFYDIKVDRAIKGKYKAGDIVKIKVAGGEYNGTNYVLEGIEQLKVGESSIFFLRDFADSPVPDEPPVLFNDSQGRIQLKDNKIVVHPKNKLFKSGEDKNKFLDNLAKQLQ